MMKVFLSTALAGLLAAAPVAMAQDANSAIGYVTPETTDFVFSELEGEDVDNLQGEEIGEIHDIIVRDGTTVTAVVISVGGFLGIGESYVAVDPASLTIEQEDPDDDDVDWEVTLDIDRASLEAAPKFEYEGRWDD